MRLSKKIAAVALAAVMSVSLLTACGGTDAPSSSSPSSSSSSSSSGADSSSSSSSSGSSSSSSSSSGTGSEGKNETIAYEKSRTAKFYKKLGTGNYTMNETLKFEPIGESMTGDMLVSTDGSRVYVDLTTRTQGMEASQIVLLDLKTQKGWYITPYKKPSADGKLGEYTVRNIKGKLQDQISPVAPVEGREFKQEWRGNDYTETQTTKATVISFVYKGNSSVPEYAELKEYNEDGVETLKVRVEYSNFKPQVDAKYLDFETILAKYDGKTGTSTVQAQEPSIASLILG